MWWLTRPHIACARDQPELVAPNGCRAVWLTRPVSQQRLPDRNISVSPGRPTMGMYRAKAMTGSGTGRPETLLSLRGLNGPPEATMQRQVLPKDSRHKVHSASGRVGRPHLQRMSSRHPSRIGITVTVGLSRLQDTVVIGPKRMNVNAAFQIRKSMSKPVRNPAPGIAAGPAETVTGQNQSRETRASAAELVTVKASVPPYAPDALQS
jgi:hypothetical protein